MTIPSNEPERQFAYMKLLKDITARRSAGLGRDLTYHIQTFGCQMNARDSEKLAGILEEIDIDFVYAENRLPVRLDIGRRAPKVACRRAPAPRKVSAPLADGIDYRALLGAVSIGIFGGCTHELSAHLSILDSLEATGFSSSIVFEPASRVIFT